MAANLKRVAISVSPDMEAELRLAKEELFCNATQNEMIRQLIQKGLDSLHPQDGPWLCRQERTA